MTTSCERFSRSRKPRHRPLRCAAGGRAPAGGALQETAAFDPKLHSVGRGEATSTATVDLPKLGEYQLLERLGAGGMGTVYKALHTKLGREVAIKVLPKGRLQDEQAVARFEREMKAIGALEHPNVVRATDAREVAGTRFLVMELLDGLDLDQVVRRCGPLRAADACEVVRQASLGLQCADEHNLVHRDIKPSNLMLTSTGQVKILDLGLARTEFARVPGEELTATGQALGTIDYMAPEQVAEKSAVDVRADIYSLGCTLYKLLTGNAPFSGRGCQTVFEKMQAHLKKAPPQIRAVRRDVPPELAAIISRMLAKNPEERFATPGQVADAIGPLAGDSDLVGLVSKALARPVAPPVQGQAPTDESLPSSMTRMFQQFRLGRRQRQAKPAAAGNRWRRWAPLLGCVLLAAVVLLVVAVVFWPGGPKEVAKKAEPAKAAADAKTKGVGRKRDPIAEFMEQRRREREKPAPPPQSEKPKPKPEPKPEPKPKPEAKPATPEPEKPPLAEAPEKAEGRLKTALTNAKTPADYKAVAEDALNVAVQAADSGNKDFAKKAAALAIAAARRADDDDLVRKATIIFLEPDASFDFFGSRYVDILPRVDLKRDQLQGGWKRDGDAIATASRAFVMPRIMFPVQVDGSYDLRLTFTSHFGEFRADVILPVESNQCKLVLDGAGWSLLETVDGGRIGGSGSPIKMGSKQSLLVKVRVHDQNVAIGAFLDNLPIINWKGKTSSLGSTMTKSCRNQSA